MVLRAERLFQTSGSVEYDDSTSPMGLVVQDRATPSVHLHCAGRRRHSMPSSQPGSAKLVDPLAKEATEQPAIITEHGRTHWDGL